MLYKLRSPPSTLLLETLLNDVSIESVAVRGKQATLHERRRVVNIVFLRLLRERGQHVDTGVPVSRTYPLIELCDGHGDQLGLAVALQLKEACLFLDDLAKQERKEFFMIARLREVLAEALHARTRSSDVKRGKVRAWNARVAVSS